MISITPDSPTHESLLTSSRPYIFFGTPFFTCSVFKHKHGVWLFRRLRGYISNSSLTYQQHQGCPQASPSCACYKLGIHHDHFQLCTNKSSRWSVRIFFKRAPFLRRLTSCGCRLSFVGFSPRPRILLCNCRLVMQASFVVGADLSGELRAQCTEIGIQKGAKK
jgi:hypothetical protein